MGSSTRKDANTQSPLLRPSQPEAHHGRARVVGVPRPMDSAGHSRGTARETSTRRRAGQLLHTWRFTNFGIVRARHGLSRGGRAAPLSSEIERRAIGCKPCCPEDMADQREAKGNVELSSARALSATPSVGEAGTRQVWQQREAVGTWRDGHVQVGMSRGQSLGGSGSPSRAERRQRYALRGSPAS